MFQHTPLMFDLSLSKPDDIFKIDCLHPDLLGAALWCPDFRPLRAGPVECARTL